MKDALGHGSNSHEIIDTKNGNRVVSQHSSHRKALNATNKLEPTPKGQMPKGGWQYQIRPINSLMDGMRNKLAGDIAAGRMLASGPKSAPAPIHDSMDAGPTHDRAYAGAGPEPKAWASSRDTDAFGRPRDAAGKSEYDEYNRDLSLRSRNGQVGSGMKFRG